MSETNTDQKPKYTQEELDVMRAESIKAYEAEIPLLKLRAEYATLLADIEVQETRRLMALTQRYSLINPQDGQEGDGQEGDSGADQKVPKKRTLKAQN